MLKLTTDRHEASRGLSATAELLVTILPISMNFCTKLLFTRNRHDQKRQLRQLNSAAYVYQMAPFSREKKLSSVELSSANK